MTPKSFEKLREQERFMREVMVACAAESPRTRRYYKASPKRVAEAWIEAGTCKGVCEALQRSKEDVRQHLGKLGIRLRSSVILAGRNQTPQEPDWRFCETCSEPIPWLIGQSAANYLNRRFCSENCIPRHGFTSEARKKALEAKRKFTDIEMLEALASCRDVERAAACHALRDHESVRTALY